MHKTVEPAILYLGTPVVLISTQNEDGSPNLAPMSSAWWLGWRCMLGLAASSKTPQNLRRTGECVLNLPSAGMVAAVDRLACTTGTHPVPEAKLRRGYRYERDKFGIAGLTPPTVGDGRRAARARMPGAARGEARVHVSACRARSEVARQVARDAGAHRARARGRGPPRGRRA